MKIASQLVVMVTITYTILLGCKKVETIVPVANNVSTNENPPIVIETSGTTTGIYSPTRQLIASNMVYSDDGLRAMEVKIWGNYADGQNNYVEVPVDPDFVLFGGGARVTNLNNTDVGVNALLSASYPKNDNTFSTYVAQSKDHHLVYYHRLWGYAIGVKMYYYVAKFGVYYEYQPEYLKNQMTMYVQTSGTMNRPNVFTYTPSGVTAICGGTKLTWTPGQFGLLLWDHGYVYNSPYYGFANGWGKDHSVSCSGQIEVSCIGFNNSDINRGGNPIIDMLQTSNFVNTNQHAQSISLSVSPGYLLTGVMGTSHHTGFGRLLYAVYPFSTSQGIVSSKDHVSGDLSGKTVIGIVQMKPSNY